MTEIWETAFVEKELMWGLEPTTSAVMAGNVQFERIMEYRVSKRPVDGNPHARLYSAFTIANQRSEAIIDARCTEAGPIHRPMESAMLAYEQPPK